MITIEQYDAAETEAIKRLTYPAIRGFKPVAFTIANFPTRITAERELLRYSDCMHELADRQRFYETECYSRDEASMIIEISREVEELTAARFGAPTRPFMSLFPPLLVLRAIHHLTTNRTATIWEIGPGSGYLGAYIVRSTPHRYRAVDNTQSLYLWQDRFFGHIANGSYRNCASASIMPDDIPEKAASIPWWLYADLYRTPPRADIVICDAAMGEMDPFAANYVIRLAREMLKNSPIGAFIFQNIGEQRINSMDYIEQKFSSAGFQKSQTPTVTIHSLKSIYLPEEFAPIGDPSDMKPAKDFLAIDKTKLLESYDFFDFIKLRG